MVKNTPDASNPSLRGVAFAAVRLGQIVRDVCAGAAGTNAYAHYQAHQQAHHPDMPVLPKDVFFREQLTARWHGVCRCC